MRKVVETKVSSKFDVDYNGFCSEIGGAVIPVRFGKLYFRRLQSNRFSLVSLPSNAQMSFYFCSENPAYLQKTVKFHFWRYSEIWFSIDDLLQTIGHTCSKICYEIISNRFWICSGWLSSMRILDFQCNQ